MSTATAQTIATPDTMPPDMIDLPVDQIDLPVDQIDLPVDQIEADHAATGTPLLDEIRIGFDELRAMSHDGLREVIDRRVMLLETVLREREDRRAAIDTAKLASRMLGVRRDRAVRIHKNVNLGSALAAVASTLLIVAVMF